MADNSIDRVRETELKAEEAVRNASSQASQIVDSAYTKAVELKNQSQDEANSKAADRVAAAHKDSQRVLEQAMGDLSGEMNALAEKARGTQVQAIMAILRSLA